MAKILLNVLEFLNSFNKNEFLNVYTFLKIMTLLITTATTKRSFSILRRLKPYLRNTMLKDHLNGLT